MEVREPSARYLDGSRFKQTEVGLIPTDWDVKPLGDLSEKVMVGIASAATHAYRDSGVVMFRNQNIKPGRLDDSDVLHIAEDYEQAFKAKRLRHGDLLTARTGYPGTTCLVPEGYAGAQSFTTLITRPYPEVVDSHYLCGYINSEAGQRYFEQAQIGGGQKNVNASALKKLPIALPPTHGEQAAIAQALADTDALIESLEQLLAKKRQIKQGAMQELLTGRRRQGGFSAAWRTDSLASVIESLDAGVSVNSDDFANPDPASEFCVLKTSCVAEGTFLSSECKRVIAADRARCVAAVRKGALIVSRMNTPNLVGECGVAEDDYPQLYLPDRLWMARLRSEAELDTRWLSWTLSLPQNRQRVTACATGTSGSMKNLSKDAFLSLTLQFPSPAEQRALANMFSDMTQDIAAVEAKLTKARHLKQAMMQALLTGRIRLAPPGAVDA